MKICFVILLLIAGRFGIAQPIPAGDLEPEGDYDNIFVTKIYSDSLSSTFVIWVKQFVAAHYHAVHTEQIIVLEGTALMTIGPESFSIKKGDVLFIPAGTTHSVLVTSKSPLKVISIQSPQFDGADRIFIE